MIMVALMMRMRMMRMIKKIVMMTLFVKNLRWRNTNTISKATGSIPE